MAQFFGIYRGTVLNVNDPAGQNRIQVMVPAVSGQTSGWAAPCSPTTPNVGDTAFVMFEGGDPSLPVFMGTAS